MSAFPGGSRGVGLLLLRAGVGAAAILQGGADLAGWDHVPVWTRILAVVLALAGGALVCGFLTPLAGILAGLGVILTIGFPRSAPGPAHLSGPPLLAILLVTDSAAVVLLGPGALSVDARLFGRREIIIPGGSPARRSAAE